MTGKTLKFLPVFFSISVFIYAVPAHADSLSSLSKKIAKGVSSLKNKSVAILAFPYHDGRISSGSSIISERMTTDLVSQRHIQVVERRLIKKILEEKHLDETGAIDQEGVKQLGSVLGVQAIVTGTLIDLDGDKTEINARMIDVGSGEILSAAEATIERTWSDKPVLPPKVEFASQSVTPAKKKQVETEPDLVPVVVEEPHKQLKLSNESFPAGHRVYYGPERPHLSKYGGQYHANSYSDRSDYEDSNYGVPDYPSPEKPKKSVSTEYHRPSFAERRVQRFKKQVQHDSE